MRSRRALAAAIIVVFFAALFTAAWPRDDHRVAAATAITTTTTKPTTTTAQKPSHPFEAADAIVPEVQLYDAPGATTPTDSMPNPTVENVPLAFLVKAHGPPGWLQVQISRRPNETLAWIRATDVAVRGVDNRIVVQRDERELTVYKGMTDAVLLQVPVATGAPATPTP
ncbi:MAG TPA: L,D-transpeptidase, partial [Acidimicrobiales bacterium]|nr:L,D-transpeptidase [Acidimicrobiales bacterium]